MRGSVSFRKTLFMGAVITGFATLPTTFTHTGPIEVSEACGSSGSTCCADYLSACPGVGEGWYDTGLCGPCHSLHECEDDKL